jgi:hypothetical protein
MRFNGVDANDGSPTVTIPNNLTVSGTITGNITGTAGGETLATVTARGASTSTDVAFGANSGGDLGIQIKYGSGASDYGRIRFYQNNSNHSTIHSFSAAWQSTTVFGSAGAINITGQNGVTFGGWNDPDAVIVSGGQSYFKGSVGIGNTSPSYKLHVNGNAYINETLFVNQTTTVEDSLIVYDNIGVGTTSPAFKLQVAGAIASRTLWEVTTSGMGASGTQARRYELARAYMDYNDWNSTGTIEVELRENYFSKGLLKKYVIYWGYYNSSGIQLTEMSGDGDNNFQVVIGSPVQQSGDNYYVPIYAEWRYYTGGVATIRTNRTRTASAPGSTGTIYVDESPSPSNITDFNADSKVTIGYPSTNIILGPSANVGIGTTSPGTLLQVSPGSSYANNPTIQVVSSYADGYDAIVSLNNTYTGGRNWMLRSTNNSQGDFSGGKLVFQDNTAGSSTSVMTLVTGGNVGIGLTSPNAPLHTAGKTLSRTTDSGWGQSAVANPNDAEVGFVWAAGGTGYPGVTSTYTRQWIAGLSPFGTGTDRWSLTNKTLGASTAITVLEGGNIGVGTTGPLFNLQVGANAGTIATTTIRLQNSYLDTNGYYGFNIDAVDNGVSGHDLRFLGRTSPTSGFSELVRIKNGGNVGIGTATPSEKLDLTDGKLRFTNTTSGRNSTIGMDDNYNFYIKNTSAGNLYLGNGTTTYVNGSFEVATAILHASAGGNVGIGTNVPAYKLDVTGTIRATGDVIAYSDRRVKENIVTLENSLDLVTKLRGVEYNKIGEEDKKIGVIAQEVLEVLPQVVQQDNDGNYSVAYGNMAGLFIEAIKQQQTHIQTLEDRISVLEQLLRQKL